MKIEARARLLASQSPKDKKLVTEFQKAVSGIDKATKALKGADDDVFDIVVEDIEDAVSLLVRKAKLVHGL